MKRFQRESSASGEAAERQQTSGCVRDPGQEERMKRQPLKNMDSRNSTGMEVEERMRRVCVQMRAGFVSLSVFLLPEPPVWIFTEGRCRCG